MRRSRGRCSAHPVEPHTLQYYLERRDPEFRSKTIEVLHVYREVELWRKAGPPLEVVGGLSYVEKPGIQAISNTAPDLPPVPAPHTSVPNRFEFIFTPKQGSWLNLVESFFGKLARTLLRGIRVSSKAELKTRIELYLREINEAPVVFKRKYKVEALQAESVATRAGSLLRYLGIATLEPT